MPNQDDLDGWRGSLETQGHFSLSSWWSFGWDATIESDDSFRRFYKLDSVLLTDRIDQVWLKGLSDRNYFGAHLYHFGGLLVNDTPEAEFGRPSDHRSQLHLQRSCARRRAEPARRTH